MNFPAGKRDRRITIRALTTTPDPDSGEPIPTPTTLATVWANYNPPTQGREPYTADQYAAFVDAEFDILYRPAFLNLNPATHDLTFDGRTYNILGVTEIERRAKLRIVAKARAEAGAPPA